MVFLVDVAVVVALVNVDFDGGVFSRCCCWMCYFSRYAVDGFILVRFYWW